MSDAEVLVIGGGISGLSTAWWLAQSGLSVEVWESNSRPGGKIQSQQHAGYQTEQAASMLMNFRPEVSELVHKAGLGTLKVKRQVDAEHNRYLLHNNNLTAVPMKPAKLIASPTWSLKGKLRLLAEAFIPPGGYEDETVSDFITRRFGREMLEKAMEPFIAGTLASDADQASATATLPRLTELERRYGSITAGIIAHKILRRRTACVNEVFSFVGGMQTITDKLAQNPLINFKVSHTAKELLKTNNGWCTLAETPDGHRYAYPSYIVLATPAPSAAKLILNIDTELSRLLALIRYAPLAIVHMGIDANAVKHKLDGSGFLVPNTQAVTINGNLWMSSIFSGRAPHGKVLLTSYVGGARSPKMVDKPDQSIIDTTLHALRPLLGIMRDPEMVHIDRHRQALPLYHGAYQAQDRAIAARLARLPGLCLEANYRGGISIRDRIVRGRMLAANIKRAKYSRKSSGFCLFKPQLAG